MWHDMEIGKQKLFTEDRSMIAGIPLFYFFVLCIVYIYLHHTF